MAVKKVDHPDDRVNLSVPPESPQTVPIVLFAERRYSSEVLVVHRLPHPFTGVPSRCGYHSQTTACQGRAGGVGRGEGTLVLALTRCGRLENPHGRLPTYHTGARIARCPANNTKAILGQTPLLRWESQMGNALPREQVWPSNVSAGGISSGQCGF